MPADKPVIEYTYNTKNERMSKKVAYADGHFEQTFYLYDASDNMMATYTKSHAADGTEKTKVNEYFVYGSKRLGIYTANTDLGSNTVQPLVKGQLGYELTDHLGNIRAVVSGKAIVGGVPTITMATDYYPFGMEMPQRSFSTNTYRFNYNGKEIDRETGLEDYGFRIYDPKVCRFLSVDPLMKQYPFYSPFQFAGNTPIQAIDLEGLEPAHYEFHGGVPKLILASDVPNRMTGLINGHHGFNPLPATNAKKTLEGHVYVERENNRKHTGVVKPGMDPIQNYERYVVATQGEFTYKMAKRPEIQAIAAGGSLLVGAAAATDVGVAGAVSLSNNVPKAIYGALKVKEAVEGSAVIGFGAGFSFGITTNMLNVDLPQNTPSIFQGSFDLGSQTFDVLKFVTTSQNNNSNQTDSKSKSENTKKKDDAETKK